MKIYEALRLVQNRLQLQVKDIAAGAGTSSGYLSRIRRGQVSPSDDMLDKILTAMETLAPGSRRKVWLTMAYDGKDIDPRSADDIAILKETVMTLDQQELAELMKVMADRFHELNRKPSEPDTSENGRELHATLR
ncbi:helix-turn-helix transcriptional regulator [Lyngbya sp. CCY1209]|uniref:helix-turn-helix transcriptional regulator n=1 Tax=Lyngbya sp. CCY1209 TaxID=2886103 RepID=UPI002D21449B|nr:helix-turn-helix transcriptional regulator [Lyngbya sp. CCY1209]MEB3884079.1 helix-turn-helix domain-containing protein [Lyngbya sp. CCY1209]